MIKRLKNGPEVLLQSEDNWPSQKDIHAFLQELHLRRRRNDR